MLGPSRFDIGKSAAVWRRTISRDLQEAPALSSILPASGRPFRRCHRRPRSPTSRYADCSQQRVGQSTRTKRRFISLKKPLHPLPFRPNGVQPPHLTVVEVAQSVDVFWPQRSKPVYKKYEIKRIFGTNRHSACWFGVQVPALIVKHNAQDMVGDTFPHRVPPNSLITMSTPD